MHGHQARRVALLAALAASSARADDAPDEQPLLATPWPWREIKVTVGGYLRVRGELWNDLDLSRGPTPTTGQPIFPTAAAGPSEHTLTGADLRVRLEPTVAVGQAVRLHLRVDLLDNIGWGSTPDVLPSTTAFAGATTSAASPTSGVNALTDAVRVKQAWGEVVLPFGTLAAGRLGGLVSWGTGFFVNNGDCIGCDHGDTGDGVALTIPLFGHYLTGIYELSASGPYVTPFGQNIDLEPRAHVNTGAIALSRVSSPEAQRRQLAAGKTLIQYGLLASYRSQELDAPAWTRPGALDRAWGPNDFVRRGLSSFAGDLWLMVHRGPLRLEAEAATVIGEIQDATNDAGASFKQAITSVQWGGLASVAWSFRFPLRLRAEVGVASGDDAPGFGYSAAPNQLTTQPGDLDGPQARPPTDTTVNNFRFHPDYHVDLILWRRIVGGVTDAVYVKPTVRAGPFGGAMQHFTVDLSAIWSRSLFASTPPGQDADLGVEFDLQARYRFEPGFEVDAAYGLFLPGAGFRNVALSLDPQPAQALELILAYRL
jgi:uncharacterized protein (TIGR04551 family)